jgi:hypothetical protein
MERDSTGGADQGWYIAEPDGTTFGPFTRGEFSLQRSRGQFSGDALAWHVDFSEWRPLARIAMSGPTRAGEASRERAAAHVDNVAAQAQSRATPNKSERQAARQATAQAAGGNSAARAATRAAAKGAPKAKAMDVDDRRRLLQGAALARAAARPAAAMTPAKSPVLPGKAPTAAAAAESSARLALAVRRFLARILDTLTLGMLGACVGYGLAWREWPQLGEPEIALLLWLSVLAIVPLAAIALAAAGRTPGKALLGLETRTPAGATPSFGAALAREVDVAWRGMGLGIPLLGFVTLAVAGATLTNHGETTWDKRARLTTRGDGDARWQPALVAVIVAIYLLTTDIWLDVVRKVASS